MLIDEDGRTTGVISGGCLEPDVAETAVQVIKEQVPQFKQYDMDEETVWGLGLGCPARCTCTSNLFQRGMKCRVARRLTLGSTV